MYYGLNFSTEVVAESQEMHLRLMKYLLINYVVYMNQSDHIEVQI